MKYDDASWHYGGEFPADLPAAAGATHTGMFLAWALLKGLGGELFVEEEPHLVLDLKNRLVTPGKFFLKQCDGKLIDEDLNEIGNQFTAAYFDFENGQYLVDYEEALGDNLETMYHVADTWESYDKISPVIEERFKQWAGGEG
jgi:hypothetical protein